MNFQLWQLRNGDQFIMNGFRYLVKKQEDGMTEVFGKGRYWAWPGYIFVKDEQIKTNG